MTSMLGVLEGSYTQSRATTDLSTTNLNTTSFTLIFNKVEVKGLGSYWFVAISGLRTGHSSRPKTNLKQKSPATRCGLYINVNLCKPPLYIWGPAELGTGWTQPTYTGTAQAPPLSCSTPQPWWQGWPSTFRHKYWHWTHSLTPLGTMTQLEKGKKREQEKKGHIKSVKRRINEYENLSVSQYMPWNTYAVLEIMLKVRWITLSILLVCLWGTK